MSKIIVKNEHIRQAIDSGTPMVDILAKEYEGEIADRVAKDSRLAKLDAVEMAMLDAGISKSSRIQDFYRTSDSEILFPVFIDRTLNELIGKNDMLSYLVSGAPVSIEGDAVKSFYVNLGDETNKKSLRTKRVAEGAELPEAFLNLGEHAVAIHKYGVAVKATYEAIRRQSVDMFTRALSYIASDIAKQQTERAIDVLVKGDGNNNAAVVDTMAGSIITVDDLINESMVFHDNNMKLDTLVVNKSMYITLQKMFFNTTNAAGILPGATFTFPQGIIDGLTVVYDNTVPDASGKAQAICLDRNYALAKYVEANSNVKEFDRNITNQTQIATISENSGFAKPFKDGARLLRES